MKKLLFLLFSIMLIFFSIFSVNASSIDTDIDVRIGLSNYTNLQNISISNNDLQIGYNYNNNFNLIYSLNSNSTFNIKKLNFNYIKLSEEFSSYTDALTYINENNISDKMYVALTDTSIWSVYIGDFSTQSDAEDFVIENDLTCSIINSDNILGIYIDESLFFIYNLEDYKLQIKTSDIININNGSYRGILEFNTNSTTFSLINVLSLEEYLYSVVPAEMPSDWNIEALKAQAVASRSYTYSMIQNSNHSGEDYDLCDSTHCQVYKGVSSEQTSTTNAVNATKEVMAYYGETPITAYYYSSNGGYTESVENVWNLDALDYLQSFEDTYETGGKVWERTFTFDELTKLAGSIGQVHTVTIKFYENSPRVSSLILIGENGTKSLEKENIRTFFSSSSGGSLESRNFTILNSSNISTNSISEDLYVITSEETNSLNLDTINVIDSNNSTNSLDIEDLSIITNTSISQNISSSSTTSISSSDTDSITFSGQGWGHGVGMSQYGANSMASLGYSYVDILEFYYKGIDIE